ncbi:MAG: FAD-binding oxidoreductase [Shinella sp.]|nr:FAD-binding oxidoreductase [Shinella sp.]
MAPKLVSVESDETLPASADVVVIGGGIIGVSTAMFLAERGIRCVVCEKGHVAGEQSGRNAGWVRQQGRDVREVELSMASLRLWKEIDARLSGATGFATCGSFYGFREEKELAQYADWMAKAKACGLHFEIVGSDRIAEIAPSLERSHPVGLFTPGDGRAEPQKAAPAIARYARSIGVTLLQNCAVTGIELSNGGVSGVRTERGPIACGEIVVAAGAWSSLLCRSIGVRLPQLKALVSMAKTNVLENAPQASVWVEGLSSRRCEDGRYCVEHGGHYVADIVPDSFRFLKDFRPLLAKEVTHMKLRLGARMLTELGYERWWSRKTASPFEKERMLDPPPMPRIIDAVAPRMRRLFEALGDISYTETWAGYVDVTPDVVPVICRVPEIPGLVLSTGYSGHGFGLGLGAGHLTADIVSGAPPIADPSEFDLIRFEPGHRSKTRLSHI